MCEAGVHASEPGGALPAGPPAAPAEQVWLSAATLVVVPATVAEHWRQQLAAHTAPGALRVGQLGQVPRCSHARPSGVALQLLTYFTAGKFHP